MDLARSEGRLSHWEEYLDLQPRQIAVLQAYRRLRPWGEERADLREATNTAVVAHSFCGAQIDIEKLLQAYVPKREEETVSPNAAAALMRGAFPSKSK